MIGAGAALHVSQIPFRMPTGSVRLGTTDPSTWSAADWAADVIPHLAFGAGVVWAHAALR